MRQKFCSKFKVFSYLREGTGRDFSRGFDRNLWKTSQVLHFEKYQGTGNDFVLIDRLQGGEELSSDAVRKLCDRHLGVGADGVLSIWPSERGDARMQVQNPDGSESENCGNGLRCVAAFLQDHGVVKADSMILEAGGKTYPIDRVDSNRFRAEMGVPAVVGSGLPAWAESRKAQRLEVDDESFDGVALSFGNPHLVLFGDRDPMVAARRYGPVLEADPAFAERVNVSFVRQMRPRVLETVVYERGSGITQACGSGACAVANAAVWLGHAPESTTVTVCLPGGPLVVSVEADGRTSMEGEAVRVFVGEWAL